MKLSYIYSAMAGIHYCCLSLAWGQVHSCKRDFQFACETCWQSNNSDDLLVIRSTVRGNWAKLEDSLTIAVVGILINQFIAK